jgi:hypothetical protein
MTDKDPINQLAQDVKYLHRLADALRNQHRISLCTFDSQGPLYIEVDEGLTKVIHLYMIRVIFNGSEKAAKAWQAIPLGDALLSDKEK